MCNREENQRNAQVWIDSLLKPSVPKNFREGLTQGVSSIGAAFVGALGCAIIAPVTGCAMGREGGGLCGGALGLLCGLFFGAVASCAILTIETFNGVKKIVFGCCSVLKTVEVPLRNEWKEGECDEVSSPKNQLKISRQDEQQQPEPRERSPLMKRKLSARKSSRFLKSLPKAPWSRERSRKLKDKTRQTK